MPANHRPWLLQGSLALATLAIAVASLCFGQFPLSLSAVGHTLIHLPPGEGVIGQIVWSVRLPRVVIALLAGGALPRPGAVEHHHGLFPVAAVIDMDTQRAAPFVDVEESAGGGFGLRLIAHVSLPVNQISVVALSEPNPAIHSGIGR